MIYLDNAATTYPKPDAVYDEMLKCMKNYCANPGRGGHLMSIQAGRAVMKVRDEVCRFFNIPDPMRLCFTKNATEALNTAIKGYIKQKEHVITTCMEHNSVIRPLKTLEKEREIELTIIKGNEFGEIDVNDIKKAIKQNTSMVICTLSSNVNGTVFPIKEIGMIAKNNGIAFLLDASQGAGSIKVDVVEMNIDMMAFPGHKGLLGPQGTGGLYVSKDIQIKPLIQGGTGSNSESYFQPGFMPDSLESGTVNTPGIVGMGEGIRFINSMGVENLNLFKHSLVKRLYEGIEDIKGIKLYSLKDKSKNSGIIALNIDGIDSEKVSDVLDKKYGIASRAGLHCAPLAHKTLGTLKKGIVRLSVGCFNTVEEIDKTITALQEIVRNL